MLTLRTALHDRFTLYAFACPYVFVPSECRIFSYILILVEQRHAQITSSTNNTGTRTKNLWAQNEIYMLTIPREMTEPGRESDNILVSPSITGLLSGTAVDGSSSVSMTDICLEPRRGGGESDVTSE